MMSIASPHNALLLIDIQSDFMPGGPLPCDKGDSILPEINHLLLNQYFPHVIATQDWHPAHHISFANHHPGHKPFDNITLYGHPQTLWPEHCIQGSTGAALHPAIDWDYTHLILRKGCNPLIDSYSGFRENYGPQGKRAQSGLAGWLHERNVKDVFLCGLARDICVLQTALDAIAAGFRTHIIWELTRPVSSANDTETYATMVSAGINIIDIPQ